LSTNMEMRGLRGAWVSIGAYLILSAIKLVIGYLYLSRALMADGINNTTDIIASVAVLIGIRLSHKPADTDHPYGHYRAETIASLITSFIMAVAGIQILYQNVRSIYLGNDSSPDMLTAWVALLCAAVMFSVYKYNEKLANRLNSLALKSAAADNRSDALVSIGAAIGIFGAQLGWRWLDPTAAILVGLIILKTAWDIFRESSHALSDGFDRSELDTIRATILKTSGVKGIKDIKARTYGSKVIVDLTVFVDANLSILQGHRICDDIERSVFKKHNVMNAHIHIEPYLKNAAGKT
jgi:cation diffusion facilitator family transporter